MTRNFLRHAASALTLSFCMTSAQAALTLDKDNLNYSQNFNSLPNVHRSDPAWTNNGTLPGWYFFAGPNLDQTVSNIRVSTTSGSDRAHISYGIDGDSDRALGFQAGSEHRYSPVLPGVGDYFGAIAVAFVNGTGLQISEFSFSYTGEQWHVSSNANVAHNLTVEYAFGASDTQFNALSWQGFNAYEINTAGVNFFTPTLSGGTSGNGNLPQNRVEDLGTSVTGLNWEPGETLWLRWTTINFPASDHGMAIDDFNFSVKPVPLPAAAWMLFSGLVGLMSFRIRNGKV